MGTTTKTKRTRPTPADIQNIEAVYIASRPDGILSDVARELGVSDAMIAKIVSERLKPDTDWVWIHIKASNNHVGQVFRRLLPIGLERLKGHLDGTALLPKRISIHKYDKVKAAEAYAIKAKPYQKARAQAEIDFKKAYLKYSYKVLRDPHTAHTKPAYVKPSVPQPRRKGALLADAQAGQEA